MSESVWTKASKQPKLPEDVNKMISNLEKVKGLLEQALKRDEANLKRMEMELAKIQAQRQNRSEK
tara:strand:- start:841 stop:1035 length:195 start_codon:yes stop_codon:yes gene_type:complete